MGRESFLDFIKKKLFIGLATASEIAFRACSPNRGLQQARAFHFTFVEAGILNDLGEEAGETFFETSSLLQSGVSASPNT